VTAIQYLIVQRIEAGVRKQGAQDIFGLESLFHYHPSFLILGFGMLCFIFGILIDIIIPLLGRKCLEKVPTNTAHLLERLVYFPLFSLGKLL
jgi:low temperature requirement protein LtrA